ncbi:MAG: hypothetical protein IJJ07_06160 [Lachnospiraceae bacterium]|nr:hypothetical protein [Lachnospiraceae bacterium]
MKFGLFKKLVAMGLAGTMMFNMASVRAFAADDDKTGGKYVSDVFIAYGKTEDDASKWLKDNGWEPVKGDFNAGKASFFDDNKLQDQNVAAVMGIKRTDDKHDAITDMAAMNMTGGYSIAQYEDLVKQKKTEINEMLTQFMAVIEEYRANYNNEGSAYGKKRADFAAEMLNRFYDGDPEGANALNDTGMGLGDLFLASTRQEGDENGGDLEQMMLESSGPAMLAVESVLVMAADTGEETWIERACKLTGDELEENLPKYVPEAEGQDISDSVAAQYLNQQYGDTAAALAEQWDDINEELRWYESYNDEHGLWQKKAEKDDAYTARIEKYFKDLEASDADAFAEESNRYNKAAIIYNKMYDVPYEGEWGENLGDFFNPAEEDSFSENPDNFLPLAAGLSEGQRVGLDYLSLEMMLIIGLGTESGLDQIAPEIQEMFGDEEEMDIYTGVNRAAFRGGVALTSEALMEQNAGRGQAYDKIWDNTGIAAISSYCAAFVGAVTIGTGAYMAVTGVEIATPASTLRDLEMALDDAKILKAQYEIDHYGSAVPENIQKQVTTAQKNLDKARSNTVPTKMGVAGRWVMGIGGAILIGAAIVKGIQMWKYYQRTMKPIPQMIVDESDIVTYVTDEEGNPVLDENGNQKKNIEFDTYQYYTSVKCNRPDVGEIGDWQDGVKEYADYGCYDVADLNADMGQEWIALYTVKSERKGDPILADSLTLQYGSDKMPKDSTRGLHLFTYTNAVDLGDTAWAFNNDKKGVYFFWAEDTGAFASATASAFSGGHVALAGIAGLILGIAGGTGVMAAKRRKEEEAQNKAETTA